LLTPIAFANKANAQSATYNVFTNSVSAPVYGVAVGTLQPPIPNWVLPLYFIVAIPLGIFLLIKRKRFAAIQASTESEATPTKNKFAQYFRWLFALSILVVLAYIAFLYIASALG
jgi:hypothetical protein